MNNRIWILIDKYIDHKIEESERNELKLWINENKRHKDFFITILSLYKKHRQLYFLKEFNYESAWDALYRKLKTRHRKRSLIIYSSVASVLLLIGISLYMFTGKQVSDTEIYLHQGKAQAILALSNGTKIDLQGKNPLSEYSEKDGTTITADSNGLLSYKSNDPLKVDYSLSNTVTVPRGGEYSLVLSDGTKVYMNANSRLEYPIHFSSKRIVKLSGEAYFEVSRDPRKPFIVEASKHFIEVLGTRFNVSAYPEDDFYATLLSGSVKLQTSSETKVLSPNQQAVVKKSNSVIGIQNVDASIYASWVKGSFEFQNASLYAIARQLSRWYDVDIQFQSENLKQIRFGGTILRHRPLSFAIAVIEKVSDVEFSRKGESLIIKSSK